MFSNIICEQFKQNISDIISNSQLPPVAAYYILKDIIHELENVCQEALRQEMIQLKQQQNKEQIQEKEAE